MNSSTDIYHLKSFKDGALSFSKNKNPTLT